MVHAAPVAVWFPYKFPIANASLILNWVGDDIGPLPIVQDGMGTQESRGMDMTSAHCRLAGMWMIMSVSDWSVTRPDASRPAWPCRLSEPMTAMFSACGCRSGGWRPSRGLTLACLMLPLRWLINAYPATPAATSRHPTLAATHTRI